MRNAFLGGRSCCSYTKGVDGEMLCGGAKLRQNGLNMFLKPKKGDGTI